MDTTDSTLPTVTEDVIETANIIFSMSTEQENQEMSTEYEDMETSMVQEDLEEEDLEQERTERPEGCLICSVEPCENDHMQFDLLGVHTCPMCNQIMGTIQPGRWHGEKGFVSDEEMQAAEDAQEEEEGEEDFADLPLYDGTLAESLAASDPNTTSQESCIPGNSAILFNDRAPPDFTGFVILGDTYASDKRRVIPPKGNRRKSVKEMQQQVQAIQGNEPFPVEARTLARKLKLSQ